MIQVLNVNKQGNKVVSYTCTDGMQTLNISKQQLANYIEQHLVTNATKQLYNGSIIIRVKDANKINFEKMMAKSKLLNDYTEINRQICVELVKIQINLIKALKNTTGFDELHYKGCTYKFETVDIQKEVDDVTVNDMLNVDSGEAYLEINGDTCISKTDLQNNKVTGARLNIIDIYNGSEFLGMMQLCTDKIENKFNNTVFRLYFDIQNRDSEKFIIDNYFKCNVLGRLFKALGGYDQKSTNVGMTYQKLNEVLDKIIYSLQVIKQSKR